MYYETEVEQERILLVGVCITSGRGASGQIQTEDEVMASLDELEELGQTAGAVTVGRVIQNRESMHPGTYIGKGKLEEVERLIDETRADTVVCDDELSPAQLKNLSDALDIKVIDRTILILDIFAGHASTSEGKLQVELAQLRYRSSHLIGKREELSRLGGGIGTRGPGEQKLEIDRRLIKNRISLLKNELEKVKRTRELTRKKRQKEMIPTVAIVGYTNAGKSTLLNYLTDAGVLSEDKLFATLDPTTRSCTTKEGEEFLFTDTVGFIRKLPHHLVQAFRSTLEEAKYADMILHVVDCTSPDMDEQMHTVYDTLRRLEVGDKPVITAFNKVDLIERSGELDDYQASQEVGELADMDVSTTLERSQDADKRSEPLMVFKDLRADQTVQISAKTGKGVEELLQVISKLVSETRVIRERLFSYDQGARVNLIRQYGQILQEEYQNEGILIKAQVPKEYAYLFED